MKFPELVPEVLELREKHEQRTYLWSISPVYAEGLGLTFGSPVVGPGPGHTHSVLDELY